MSADERILRFGWPAPTHHLAVLLPYLTAAGRTRLDRALAAASARRESD